MIIKLETVDDLKSFLIKEDRKLPDKFTIELTKRSVLSNTVGYANSILDSYHVPFVCEDILSYRSFLVRRK